MISKSDVLNSPAIKMPSYHHCISERSHPFARWIIIFTELDTWRTALAAEFRSCEAPVKLLDDNEPTGKSKPSLISLPIYSAICLMYVEAISSLALSHLNN
jgi:hypothetical protein